MTHLAIDLALGTSGFCWGPRPTDCRTHTCTIPASRPLGQRLSWWRRRVSDLLDNDKVPRITSIYVEAPISYGHNGDRTQSFLKLAKLHGAIEVRAHGAGVTYDDTIKPATLKSWATGKGNADKDLMMTAARDRFDWDGTDHNEADSVILWHYVAELKQRGAA